MSNKLSETRRDDSFGHAQHYFLKKKGNNEFHNIHLVEDCFMEWCLISVQGKGRVAKIVSKQYQKLEAAQENIKHLKNKRI